MPQTKTIRSKNSKKAPAPRVKSPEEEVGGAEASFPAKKAIKPIEVEEEETAASPEKLEEVSPFGEVPQEDDAEDEAGLDEEELNPFGDKWEV